MPRLPERNARLATSGVETTAATDIMVLRNLPFRALAVAALAIVTLTSLSIGPTGTEDAVEASNLPLRKVADVPLGGRTTRFDYESIDSSRHLLFIAHLGDGEVVAFNTEMSRVVGRVANVSSVHGVLAIPELGRVYASATGTNEVVAIDMATLEITARIPAGVYPDGMAYAPDVHKLYVSDETGGTLTVIDAQSNRRIATISLGGEAGNTRYDPVSKHIFVNVQTRNQLFEIDPARDLLHLLYVAGEAGVVSMFRVEANTVSKLGDGHVGPNAHVVAVDLETHRAYFPLKNFGGRTVLRILEPNRQGAS